MQGETTTIAGIAGGRDRRAFDWRFLALALAMHALLLLVPALREPVRVPERKPMELWLGERPERRPPVDPEASPEPAGDDPAPVPVVKATAPPTAPAVTEPAPATTVTPVPDARRILDGLGEWHWQEAAPGPAPIARLQDAEIYRRLSRPLLPRPDNLFNDLVQPATPEILDRWLEPGGVQQVVVRLPNGTVVCGRQEAVNDFRPWQQMPMMFGRCGGGGKR